MSKSNGKLFKVRSIAVLDTFVVATTQHAQRIATARERFPVTSDGRLHATVDGGYPIVYIMADGGELCPACANGENGSDATVDPEAEEQWRIIDYDVFYEGSSKQCDHCGAEMESAYGDPDADNADAEVRS